MTPLQYDLIAFDWDGTLYDSTSIIVRCIQEAVRDVGGSVPSDEAASYVIGMSLMPALAKAAPDVPESQYAELGIRYRHHYAKHHDDLTLFSGILPMLSALKQRGHLLAVATGKSRKGLDSALGMVDLRGIFDTSRTADKTAGKPDPKMLYEIMAELGVSPTRTLMVGDTTHDLQMASHAGCDSLGVSYGAHRTNFLEACKPRFIAHTVQEMADWLSLHG